MKNLKVFSELHLNRKSLLLIFCLWLGFLPSAMRGQEAVSYKSSHEAKNAAEAAAKAADALNKAIQNETDCSKIPALVAELKKKAAEAAEAAKQAAENTKKDPNNSGNKGYVKDANAASDKAEESLNKALGKAKGIKKADDLIKKIEALDDEGDAGIKKMKDYLKEEAARIGNENACDSIKMKKDWLQKLEDTYNTEDKPGGSKELPAKVRDWLWTHFYKISSGKFECINCPPIPENLIITAVGTGKTTGTIGILKLNNPSGSPVSALVGPFFIPARGGFQPYIIHAQTSVTVPPQTTVNIPLNGYCADIFSAPVPEGKSLPPVHDWINPCIYENTAAGLKAPNLTNVTNERMPTFPGTNILLPVIHINTQPEIAAPVLLEALLNIEASYDELKANGQISTPFSGNPEKEKESVIQQTFWRFTSALSGKAYGLTDFKENTIRELEAHTGFTTKEMDKNTRDKIATNINDFWNTFTAVGEEAKIYK